MVCHTCANVTSRSTPAESDGDGSGSISGASGGNASKMSDANEVLVADALRRATRDGVMVTSGAAAGRTGTGAQLALHATVHAAKSHVARRAVTR